MNVRAALVTIFGSATVSAGAPPLHAQTRAPLPVDSIVALFERETRAHSYTGDGVGLIVEVTNAPGRYSARKDSLLDRLERLVDTSPDKHVRSTAAQWVAFAGEAGRVAPPLPGIMRRLERIYRRRGNNQDPGVRISILSSLPLQGERGAAAALLRTIASQPDTTNDATGPEGYLSVGDPRTEALAGLSQMGQEGRAVLQAMYRSGQAASPQSRITLEHMAQRGFPVTDAVERRRAANRQIIQP